MNEQIRELIEKSGAGDVTPPGFHKYLEKFAELIVAQAIGVVQKRYMGDNNREDMEVKRCVESLKNHFGVSNAGTTNR